MNKIIFSGILIITLLTNHHSMYSSIGAGANQPARNQRAIPAQQSENNAYENIYTIEELRRQLIAQPTHAAKAEFIARILEHQIEPVNPASQPVTVGQQITNAQNLSTIIQQEISLRSGYLWNSSENQPEIEWLKNQKTLIDHKISLLKWQARTFGERTLWTTVKWLAIYFGVIATIYAAQPYIESSYNELYPEKEKYKPKSISELTFLGPNALWDTTSQAVGYTYNNFPTSKVKDAAKIGSYALYKAGSDLLSGVSNIGSKGAELLPAKETSSATSTNWWSESTNPLIESIKKNDLKKSEEQDKFFNSLKQENKNTLDNTKIDLYEFKNSMPENKNQQLSDETNSPAQ